MSLTLISEFGAIPADHRGLVAARARGTADVAGTFPIVGFFAGIQLKMMTGFSDSKDFETSANLAGQVVENIRTVVAMGTVRTNQEVFVHDLFCFFPRWFDTQFGGIDAGSTSQYHPVPHS